MSDPQVQKWMIQEMELAMERLNVSLSEVQSWLTNPNKIPSDPNKLTLYQCISNYAEMIYATSGNNYRTNPFLLPFQTQIHKQSNKKQTITCNNLKIKQEPIDLTQDNNIQIENINIIQKQCPKMNNITNTNINIKYTPNIPLPPIQLPQLPIPLPHINTNISYIKQQQPTPLPLPNLQLSPSSPSSPISDIKMSDITNINITPIDNINSYLYAFPPSIQPKQQIKIKKTNIKTVIETKHKHRRKHVRNKKPKVKPETKNNGNNNGNDIKKGIKKVKTEVDRVRSIKSRGGGGIIKPMNDSSYRLISRVDIESKLEHMKYSGVSLAHCFVKRTDKIRRIDPITKKQNSKIEIIIREGHKCKTMNCSYPHLYSQKCHWKRHALTEHCNRKFECQFCGAVFRQQTQRKEHIINKHTQSIQKWLCPYGCGGVFSQFRGVVRHVKFDRKCDARKKYFNKNCIQNLKNKWDNDIMKSILKFNTTTNTNEKNMVTNGMKIKIRKKKNMNNKYELNKNI
eukprot:456825_1